MDGRTAQQDRLPSPARRNNSFSLRRRPPLPQLHLHTPPPPPPPPSADSVRALRVPEEFLHGPGTTQCLGQARLSGIRNVDIRKCRWGRDTCRKHSIYLSSTLLTRPTAGRWCRELKTSRNCRLLLKIDTPIVFSVVDNGCGEHLTSLISPSAFYMSVCLFDTIPCLGRGIPSSYPIQLPTCVSWSGHSKRLDIRCFSFILLIPFHQLPPPHHPSVPTCPRARLI